MTLPSSQRSVVTEAGLEAFRSEHLGPAALLRLVERHVRVLLRIPVGVGKTHAAVDLLLSPMVYEAFDLVVYAAPAWAILDEVLARLRAGGFSALRVLEARPAERCGDLDTEWQDLEGRGCATVAKKRLCEMRCPHWDTCPWPQQMRHLDRTRLIVMTEQRIEQIRLIVPLVKELAAARRVLVILDEARLLDAQLEVRLPRQLVRMFLSVIRSTGCRKRGWQGERARWEADLSALIDVRDRRAFAGLKVKFGVSLHAGFAYHVQREGLSRHGRDFVYLGYDLSLLATSQDCERWLEDDVFCFIGRPSL